MAQSIISAYCGIFHANGINRVAIGSTLVPSEASGTHASNGSVVGRKNQIVAAGAQVTIWDGTLTGALRDWTGFYMKLASGALALTWEIDTPTSESNLVPSGSNPKTMQESIGCLLAMQKDNNRVLINPTNNTLVGMSGSSPSIWSAGVPGAGGATNLWGKYYKLKAWNLAATDAVIEEWAAFD